jgi:Cu-Zn family superoxide dismutase
MKNSLIVALFLVVAGCGRAVTVSSPPVVAPAGPAAAPPVALPIQATATVFDLAGTTIGTVSFSDTPAGLLVIGSVSGLGLGVHGTHLHTIGKCEPPFTTAGGHFNPTGAKHGFRNPAGHHAGDMPNVVARPAGPDGFQFLVPGVTLTGSGGLIDADGASIVFHSAADDFITDPSGASGGRLACGVITLAK